MYAEQGKDTICYGQRTCEVVWEQGKMEMKEAGGMFGEIEWIFVI